MMLRDPVKTFEALAHETRLAVVRLLIPAGADGLCAGVIGQRIRLPPNALSFHLGRLTNSGLLRMRRSGRNQFYRVDYERLSALTDFLVEDCCANAPSGCLPDCPTLPQSAEGCGAGRSDRRRSETPTKG